MSRSLPLRNEIKHANNHSFSYSKIAVTSVDNAHVRNFPPLTYGIHSVRPEFAYKNGESCGNALIKMQHEILSALDNLFNKAVRLFTMDFSKAFDSVNHHLLAEKLKVSPLSTHVVNWYKSFPFD